MRRALFNDGACASAGRRRRGARAPARTPSPMNAHRFGLGAILLTCFAAAGCGLGATIAQKADSVEVHVAAATRAAGTEHTVLLDLCAAPEPAPPVAGPRSLEPPPPPPRSEWYVPPVRVFDNL
jgi:hypothetical protein